MNRAQPTPAAVALATLVEIYGDSHHLPEMTIPFDKFDRPPTLGEEVEVLDSTGARVRAKVVKLTANVQPDFDTYAAANAGRQEGLPIP